MRIAPSVGLSSARPWLLALCAAAFALVPLAARADLTSGLVLYYDFNQTSGSTVPDQTASGLTGTLENTAHMSFAAGKSGFGNALDFGTAGADTDYLFVPNGFTNTILGLTTWTMSMWVYPRSLADHPTLVSGDTGGRTDLYLEIANTYFAQVAVAGVSALFGSGNEVAINAWHHIVFVKSGATTCIVYIDGSVIGNGTVGQTTSTPGDLQIGKFHQPGYQLNGLMDDFAIWNRALSQSEVAQLYSARNDLAGGACASNDTDCDGVPDTSDPAPCDASIDAASYYPAKNTFDLVTFEDLWPANGDFDFNDQTVATSWEFVRKQGNVVGLEATFNLRALGASVANGLYLHLPLGLSSVASATLQTGTGAAIASAPLASLGGVALSDAVFQIADDTRALFGGATGYLNTVSGQAAVATTQLTLSVKFASALADGAAGFNTAAAPFDVFIARTGSTAYQIHQAAYSGSATGANSALFRTGNDGSNTDGRSSGGANNTGRYYVNSAGIPFSLEIPQLADWPLESTSISSLYPQIVAFGSSAGATNTSYYTPANESTQYSWQHSASGGAQAAPSTPNALPSFAASCQ